MIWCHLNESLYIVIVSKQLQHWCQQCTSWYTGTTLHISTCTTFLVSVSATNHNGTEWNSAWEVVEYNKDYSLHTNHRQNIHITDSKKKTLKFESAVGDNPFIKKECLYVYLKSQKKQQEMTTSGITDWYATTEAGMNQLFFITLTLALNQLHSLVCV